MVKEFEGRTEQEAIDTAVAALGLERHQFEVEIIDSQKSGLFGLNRSVRIRVHLPDGYVSSAADEDDDVDGNRIADEPAGRQRRSAAATASVRGARLDGSPEPEGDLEQAVVTFLSGVAERMGYAADVRVMYREEGKIGLRLDSEHASILIGRKGRNLDALQLLTNVVSGRIGDGGTKVVLDSEGYRGRREEQLVQLAHNIGDQVMQSRASKLLEPMNPYERRLIHTTLNDIEGIGTESEGDGLYKQVRVFYRGGGNQR